MQTISIPIIIEEWAGLDRENAPVRIGVPFPRGILCDLSKLLLKNSTGELVSLQTHPLAYWPDHTIKWALTDFFVSIPKNSRCTYTMLTKNKPEFTEINGIPKLTVKKKKDEFLIDTTAAKFIVHRQNSVLPSSVKIDGEEILEDKSSQILMIDSKGRKCITKVDKLLIEQSGPLRCTFFANGRFENSRAKTICNFMAWLTFFGGTSLIQMEFQIHNPRAAVHPGGLWDLGDPGSIYFQDLSFHLALEEGQDQTDINYQLYEDPVPMDYRIDSGKDEKSDRHYELNLSTNVANQNILNILNNFVIYQDSSGGKNWNNRNHVNRNNELKSSFRGFRIYSDENIIGEGLRANPLVSFKKKENYIFSAVQDFWQNFPKSIELNNNILTIRLFPKHYNDVFELQGGEKKRHTVFLDFGISTKNNLIPHMQKPLHVLPAPEWIENTQAISYFVPQRSGPNNTYDAYIKNIIEGPYSFFGKRELIDEYGWRNFGDLYADHEAINFKEHGNMVSHYNNQYDFIYGAFIHFLRSGDRRWYELMRQAARHVIDIDIYHTKEDKAAYNHGFFWHTDHYKDAGTSTHRTYTRKTSEAFSEGNYGGGPSNEHNYTTGLLHYFFLTGDLEARKAVLELAEWVIAMDDGSKTILGLLDEGPTGLASQTVSEDYHKPGRGAGNSINALLDAYHLTFDRKYLLKAEALIQRCIHPKDDIADLNLDDPEYRWSYLVFLSIIGKYLDLKIEHAETDYYFFYTRDSLLHYANWMVENEMPYKEQLDRVQIPTETWPAQDVRKSGLLHIASKYGRLDQQEKFTKKANFFFERCLDDLLGFETAYMTRPLVILAVHGFIHLYFNNKKENSIDHASHNYNYGKPTDFVPQKLRFKSTFKTKLTATIDISKKMVSTKLRELIIRVFKKNY